MRTATVDICGGKHPAAFSLNVLLNLEKRFDLPASDALEKLLDENRVEDVVWLLAELLAAGAAVTPGAPPPPSKEDILKQVGLDDLHVITGGILASMREFKPRVRVDSKNAVATQKTVGARLRGFFTIRSKSG